MTKASEPDLPSWLRDDPNDTPRGLCGTMLLYLGILPDGHYADGRESEFEIRDGAVRLKENKPQWLIDQENAPKEVNKYAHLTIDQRYQSLGLEKPDTLKSKR
jgi:hypothetical protein